MATPTKPTPSKGPDDLAFQPLSYRRDGTPNRILPSEQYEKRRDMATRFFLNQLASKRGNASPSRGTTSTDLASSPSKLVYLAIAVLIPMAAVVAPSFINNLRMQTSEGPVTWSTVFSAQSKEDWSYGCHLVNITQDKNTSTAYLTVKFSDLPQDAFQSEQLQKSLPDVLWQQVNELGNYAFERSSLSLQMSAESPVVDVNATLDGSQKLTVFVGKLTAGALAQRLAQNEMFRGAMTAAGFAPKSRSIPESIKGKWLEPMVENAVKTQEDAAQGLLGYMYKVQQSYDAVKALLHETEAKEANLSREVQSKSAQLLVAEQKLGQLEKNLNKTVKEFELLKSSEDTLRKWRADAKLQITQLESQVATKDQSLQQKEKALNQLTAEYTTLKAKAQELQETLEGTSKNKSELQELRKQISVEKDGLQKEKDSVVSQLLKMLEERFNDSSLKDTSPSPSKLVKAIEQNVMKSAKTFTGVQKQLQAELEKLNKDLTATADKYKVEALAAQRAFNSTIELKDKEHDAKVKDLESKSDQAVQDATKTLQAELAELSRKLLAAEKKIASYDSKLADADKKIEGKNTLIKDLQDRLAQAEKKLKAAEVELKKSTTEKEDVSKQKTTFEDEVKQLKDQHAQAVDKLKRQDDRFADIEKLLDKVMTWMSTADEMKQEWQKIKSAAKGS